MEPFSAARGGPRFVQYPGKPARAVRFSQAGLRSGVWFRWAALVGMFQGCLISPDDVEEWAEYTCPPGPTDCDYPYYDSGVGDTAFTEEIEDWRETCRLNLEEWATEGGCVLLDGLVLDAVGCEYVSFQGGEGGPLSARIEFLVQDGVNLDLALYLGSDPQERVAWSQEAPRTGSDAIFVNPLADDQGFLRVTDSGLYDNDTLYTMQICVDGTDLRN
jgi:hypothetical protein